MGRKNKYLQDADEQFVVSNSGSLTVSEIARKRKVPYSHVYNFMCRKGIPMLPERSPRKSVPEGKRAIENFLNDKHLKGYFF